nr:PREDICTED: uncharacterized protein LOC109038295 [Bemisia tabaci]
MSTHATERINFKARALFFSSFYGCWTWRMAAIAPAAAIVLATHVFLLQTIHSQPADRINAVSSVGEFDLDKFVLEPENLGATDGDTPGRNHPEKTDAHAYLNDEKEPVRHAYHSSTEPVAPKGSTPRRREDDVASVNNSDESAMNLDDGERGETLRRRMLFSDDGGDSRSQWQSRLLTWGTSPKKRRKHRFSWPLVFSQFED